MRRLRPNAGLLLLLLGLTGEQYVFSTLPAAVVITVVDLVADIGSRRPPIIRLIDIWRLAFAYLFGSEVLLALWDVHADFGVDIAAPVEGLIVAAFGATLLGYSTVDAFGPGANRHQAVIHRISPAVLGACLVSLSTLVLGYVAVTVTPQSLLTMRGMRDEERLLGPASFAITAAMVVQIVLTAQFAMLTRRPARLAYSTLIAALCFLTLYVNGTRYLLGFAAAGVLFFVARFTRPMSRRQVAVLGCAILTMAAVQGTMRGVRGVGLGGSDFGTILSSLAQRETYFSSEGMLRVHAWVHRKDVFAEQGRALEHGFLLYWWVPRALWEAKPTMDGYWLAHEVMADGNVSAGHSVAGGFALPPMLDFGPHGGIVFCFLYGLALWWLDRFIATHGAASDPAATVSALLPFTVFFAMRSPQTSLIFLQCCLGAYLPIFVILNVSRQRLRRVAPPRPVGQFARAGHEHALQHRPVSVGRRTWPNTAREIG